MDRLFKKDGVFKRCQQSLSSPFPWKATDDSLSMSLSWQRVHSSLLFEIVFVVVSGRDSFIAWIKTNFIPVNELVNKWLS
jgi:hypothetical protein